VRYATSRRDSNDEACRRSRPSGIMRALSFLCRPAASPCITLWTLLPCSRRDVAIRLISSQSTAPFVTPSHVGHRVSYSARVYSVVGWSTKRSFLEACHTFPRVYTPSIPTLLPWTSVIIDWVRPSDD